MDRCQVVVAIVFAFVCLQSLSCHAAATGTEAVTNNGMNDGCTYQGTPIPVGGVYVIDDCTECVCQTNKDLSCAFKSCPQIISCSNPLDLDGVCCPTCPYNFAVWKVEQTNPTAITAGKPNDVALDLVFQVSTEHPRVIPGDGLIKVSAWSSKNADGSGHRVGYNAQILSDEQADRDLTGAHNQDYFGFGGYEFRIDGIEFVLDASDATCSEMEYLCVELAKGDNPTVLGLGLPFTVQGVASEFNETEVPSNLVNCTNFPACQSGFQDTCTRKQVSFSVAKESGQIAPEPVALLGWSDVFNNVGGAFDSEAGVFTSPETGSFFFIYQIMETPDTQLSQVRLMKNDEELLPGSSNSNHVILDLEVGDTVWLQLQGELVGSPERFSTFSGFLI